MVGMNIVKGVMIGEIICWFNEFLLGGMELKVVSRLRMEAL